MPGAGMAVSDRRELPGGFGGGDGGDEGSGIDCLIAIFLTYQNRPDIRKFINQKEKNSFKF
jgi:hypothetical protein